MKYVVWEGRRDEKEGVLWQENKILCTMSQWNELHTYIHTIPYSVPDEDCSLAEDFRQVVVVDTKL